MEEIYKIIKKGLVLELKEGKKKRDDILVSYLDAPGKSGAEYAKLFADKNDIYFDKIVEPDLIERTLTANKNIKALVFIDDFCGTGTSICDYLERLKTKYPNIFELQNLKLHVGIVCGFNTAKQKIEDKAKSLNVDLTVTICDILDERDKCFSEKSKIFTDNTERLHTRAICYDKGSLLEKSYPLGFGDCQTTIVFSKTCPNNTLPILWQEKNNWKALFKRL